MAAKKKTPPTPKASSVKEKPTSQESGWSNLNFKKRMIWMIFALSFLMYGTTMWNGYSMDDELVVKENQLVAKGISGIPKIFKSRYSVNEKQNYEYRPVVLTSFAIEYQFFGENPAASHFFNIILYALTGVVLFLLLLELFKNHHWILPALTVFIFMIHPLHSEVVASIKNRDEILSLLFALLATLYFFKASEQNSKWGILFGILFMGLSLLSKKSSLPMIAIIPFTIWFFGKPSRARMIFTVVGLLGAYKAMRAMYIVLASGSSEKRQLLFLENPLYTANLNLVERIPVAIETIGFYLQKFIFPHPLVSYYGYNTIELGSWTSPKMWLYFVLIAVMLYFAIREFKNRTPIAYGVIFFFVAISIFANFVVPAVGIVAERFAFASTIGLSLIVAELLIRGFKFSLSPGDKWKKIPRNMVYVLGGLLLVYSVKTIDRNADWNSAASLYKADVETVPKSAKLNSLMASVYADQINKSRLGLLPLTAIQKKTKIDSAIYFFHQALDVYPDYIAVNNNLGTMYFNQREAMDTAKFYFSKAVQLDTAYAQAYFNLASVYDLEKDMYSLMEKMIRRVTNIADTNIVEGEPTKNIQKVERAFMALRLVERNLMFSMNDLMRSQSKEDLMGKVRNIPMTVRENVSYYFRGMDVRPNADSLAYYFSGNLQRFLNNEVSGQPAQVVRFSILQSCGMDMVSYVASLSDSGRGPSPWINYAQRRYFETRDSMWICLNQTLVYQATLASAYEKLIASYNEFAQYDSVITLCNRLEKNPLYQPEQLLVHKANSYLMKGETKTGIDHLKKAASLDEKQLFRLNLINYQLSVAKNGSSAMVVGQWVGQKKNELKQIYSIISSKSREINDHSTADEFAAKAEGIK